MASLMADAQNAIAGDAQRGQALHILNPESDRGRSHAAAGMNSITSSLRGGKPAVVQDGTRTGCTIGLAWLQLGLLRGHPPVYD